ncbi:MAG: prepilin peptidase [Polymorphobacter sp.]
MTIELLLALAGAAVGLVAGSFGAALVARWGAGRSLAGRSGCDGCGRQLGVVELIPLAGFALVRGRCPTCGHRIDRRLPLTELAAATIGAVALALQPGLAGAATALFGWGLLILALFDARFFWLPDRVTLPLLAAGLLAGLAGVAPGLEARVVGAAAGYGALTLVALGYRAARGRDGLGGGDAKLFAAIGAWLGWSALPWVLCGAALLGLGGVGVTRLRGRVWTATDRLPFGCLLALAAAAAQLVSVAAPGARGARRHCRRPRRSRQRPARRRRRTPAAAPAAQLRQAGRAAAPSQPPP